MLSITFVKNLFIYVYYAANHAVLDQKALRKSDPGLHGLPINKGYLCKNSLQSSFYVPVMYKMAANHIEPDQRDIIEFWSGSSWFVQTDFPM